MSNWTNNKPTEPGVYAVRGFQPGRASDEQKEAVVEVRTHEGELVCNLHECNSNDNFDDWYPVSNFYDSFEWLRYVPEVVP